MQRTFKTRLKVNDVESNILAQWCGVSRLAYNVCLDQWNRELRERGETQLLFD